MQTNHIYNKLLQLSNTCIDTNTSTCNPIKTILDTLNSDNNIRYCTGFESIDTILKGGLAPETLTILGGATGIGKSTIALQMAYYISNKYKKDVLFLALEMSESQLYLKLLSMLSKEITDSCINCGASPLTVDQIKDTDNWGWLAPDTGDLLVRAATELQNNTNLYIKSCVEQTTTADIRQIIENHISTTGNAPIVFVDYLHNVKSTKQTATEKQVIDECVDTLKKLCHKHKTAIVALSSLNRASYEAPDLTSLCGSGQLEYTADFVLLLSNHDTGRKESATDISKRTSIRSCRDTSRTRTVQLTAVKNRFGPRDVSTLLRFNEEYNQFQEISASSR